MSKKITLILMAIAIIIGAYGTSFGFRSYATSFQSTYPNSPLSALSTVSGQAGNICTVCHGASAPPLNSYGTAYLNSGNFASIESQDSDGDTFSNVIEINAGTFPGNASSKPPTADTTAPTVSLSAPANGASFTTAQNVAINATASDAVGVTKVEFYDGTTLLGTDTASPYSFTWAISSGSNGSHSLTAKAYDAANNIGTSAAVSVTVNIATADTTAPTVSITAPANGASFTTAQNVAINATASDAVGVTKVEFYDGTTLLGTDTASPYSFTWAISSGSNGSHSLTAKAYDAANNIGTSAAVSVTVNIATAPPPVLDGAQLYSANCAQCHNPLATSEVKGRTASQIQSAIDNNRGGMGFLSGLTSAEVQAIADALAVTPPPAGDDTTAPRIRKFSLPKNSASLTVPVLLLIADDNVGVTGYALTETPSAPTSGWSGTPPTSYTFASEGKNTLYAWAKDEAGNVSTGKRARVNIRTTLPTVSDASDNSAPKVKQFSLVRNSTSLTVPILALIAYDNVGVTGYALTETPSAPTSGWSGTPPTSYTFSSEGQNTLYAWAKDEAGNISKGRKARTEIGLNGTGNSNDDGDDEYEDGHDDAVGLESVLLPAPASQEIFAYDPVESTLRNSDLSIARPLAISGLGDYISIKADIGQFAEPVDAYITLYSPSETSTEPVTIFTLKGNNEFEFLSDLKEPWRSNVTDIKEQTIDLHISTLLSGKYMLVFEVTPVGRQDVYYHWITYFIIQ